MFTVSSKSRYAMRTLLRLASIGDQVPVSLGQLAEEEGLSLKYLEAIFSSLKSRGIVRSQRGSAGGYVLGRKPSEISALDVLEALEGMPVTVNCLEDTVCSREADCESRRLWSGLQDTILRYLSTNTLESLQGEDCALSESSGPNGLNTDSREIT